MPRQYSTGGKARLFSISKRGNVYLRKMLIHGARAAVLRVKRDSAPFGAWLNRLDARSPKNVVVVAMANKLARHRLGGSVERQRLSISGHARITSAEKTRAAWKRFALPLSRTMTTNKLSTEVCTGQQGRKNSHNGVSAA